MAVALSSPNLISDIVAVDNAPVDATLSRDFAEYVRAMKKIEDAQTTRQADADKILQEVEEVSHVHYSSVVLGESSRG
jgi:hypothetical protein